MYFLFINQNIKSRSLIERNLFTLGCSVDAFQYNQLLKYKPEAIPTLNLCDTMCTKDAQEYYFLFAHN